MAGDSGSASMLWLESESGSGASSSSENVSDGAPSKELRADRMSLVEMVGALRSFVEVAALLSKSLMGFTGDGIRNAAAGRSRGISLAIRDRGSLAGEDGRDLLCSDAPSEVRYLKKRSDFLNDLK